jgi:AraC family transcriptional regulator, regulatory protein of adaptative response / methylated-DNA-[protein]-cysteine methyltransferase
MFAEDYARVEQAIRFLEENYQSQPDLKEVADRLNLSEYHFQRLFRRWAGISPKRFVQFLTVEHAKQLLQESRSLLTVAYESGLSSPGRLHDLFVSVEAVTPGEYKKRGFGLEIDYGIHDTPFGWALIGVTRRGICGLNFIQDEGRAQAVEAFRRQWPEAALHENPSATQPLIDEIFVPSTDNANVPLNLFIKGTNFQIKVWEAILRIPPGYVLSYADIAREIGQPRATQAVGRAVGSNPIAYIIPCHRVIHKFGLSGYYHWGSARKKAILGWEASRRAVSVAAAHRGAAQLALTEGD